MRNPDRHLDWEACFNVRDLGGLTSRDGRETKRGVFVRADIPSRLTADGRAELLRYGIRTLVDLREPGQIEAEPSIFMTPSPFGRILASTTGASATVGGLLAPAERPVRWTARTSTGDKMTNLSISIPIAAVLIPGVAAAHPEHFSSGAFGFAHYLTDPFHVGLTGAAILLFIAASRALSRRLSTKRRTQ